MNISAALLLLALGVHVLQAAEPLRLLDPDPAWVADTMGRLQLRDKVAQLVKVRVFGRFMNTRSPEFVRLAAEIEQNHVGGLVLFAGNVYESAVILNRLQALSSLPLIVSSDFERGASFRIADTTSFPWTMAIGATASEELAYQQGAITAREARALGVHWVFAPVLDVNNNPDNPVINIRSYGEDPRLVARLGAAFIRGCRDNGALATAKHFPGHGDTATDTHIGLAVVASDRARLESVELVPFRAAIAADVDSVMTAHVAVPEITGEAGLPATLSAKILTGLLRDDLKFKGLIVTDAMEMGGITTRFSTGDAAVRALKAGADMILLPPETGVAIDAVVRAVQNGEIAEAAIDRAVERVLTAKTRLGLHLERTVDTRRIAEAVASPESLRLAQETADRSITLLRDRNGTVPIGRARRVLSVVMASDPDPAPGALFQAELRRRLPSLRTTALDPRTPEEAAARVAKSAKDADVVVCSTFVRVVSGKGDIALPAVHRKLLGELLAAGRPVVWVAFGSPYVLRLQPGAPAYMCTFSYSDVSQAAAARALAGEIAITGKMPVSIPGQSRVGDGLEVPPADRPAQRAGTQR